MKKILMSTIFILICIILVLLCLKGLSIGKLNIKSVEQIKQMDKELEEIKNEAVENTNKLYPSALAELNSAIKTLNISKNKYEEKVKYFGDGYSINAMQIEKYKIEFLWTRLGNYADKHKVKMQMNVIEDTNGRYNLDFYVVGTYINVTDFIYTIENDTELNFKISDFVLLPDNTITTTTTRIKDQTTTEVEEPYSEQISIKTEEAQNDNLNPTGDAQTKIKNAYNPDRLEATFKVYDIEINFN